MQNDTGTDLFFTRVTAKVKTLQIKIIAKVLLILKNVAIKIQNFFKILKTLQYLIKTAIFISNLFLKGKSPENFVKYKPLTCSIFSDYLPQKVRVFEKFM
jgi:hypothetical protein